MLDSEQAWSAGTAAAGQWMTIDLGTSRQVVGVAIQGRRAHAQHVTSFTVQHSMDGVSFASLPTTFTSDATGVEHLVSEGVIGEDTAGVMFSQVTARHVRIVVQTWQDYASMRAGVLVNPGQFRVTNSADLPAS